jgi:4-amino-4-deoxy-L-arabinose transferase-like glycosyltransferase
MLRRTRMFVLRWVCGQRINRGGIRQARAGLTDVRAGGDTLRDMSTLDATNSPGNATRWLLIFLIGAAIAIFLQLGDADLTSSNEGQRATPPMEMLQTGDCIVPTLNRQEYIKKPPLLYWAIAGLYAATGTVNEFLARTPTALTALALLLLLYRFARRHIGEAEARAAALMLLATPFFIRRAQVSDLDMPLALATFAAITAMWSALDATGRARWMQSVIAGIALGAGLMLKGPVPLLFVIPAWAVHEVVASNTGHAKIKSALKWTVALLIADAIITMLHAWVPQSAPQAIHQILSPPYGLIGLFALWLWLAWRAQTAGRSARLGVLLVTVAIGVVLMVPWGVALLMRLGWDHTWQLLHTEAVERTYTASEINAGGQWFYAEGLLYCMAPWSLLAPLWFAGRVRPANRAWLACGLTAFVSVAVFSLIAGKEQDYVLPAYAFVAIAIGGVLVRAGKSAGDWTAVYVRRWSGVVLGALVLGGLGLAVYATVSFHQADVMMAQVWISAVALLAVVYAFRAGGRRVLGIAIGTILITLQFQAMAAVRQSGAGSIQDLAVTMRELRARDLRVEASEVKPQAAFYLRTPIVVETDPKAVAERLRGSEPYYYLCHQRELQAILAADPGEKVFELAGFYTRSHYMLIGNRPLPDGLSAHLRHDEKPGD